MWNLFSDGKPWFRPKSFGYGAGLPIAWQGWALLASFIATLMGLAFLAERARGYELAAVIFAMLILAGLLVAVAKARTEGGWRWRSGDDDG